MNGRPPISVMLRPDEPSFKQLASYRHCLARMQAAWPEFASRRRERLQQGLFDAPVEKIAENIVEDLFTTVLDWSLSDVNLQVGRADVVLSGLGIKRLVVEVKRPGTLVWHRRAVEAALDQARRHTASQRVGAVSISDGHMLYAADVAHGGMHDRALVALDGVDAPEDLWWVLGARHLPTLPRHRHRSGPANRHGNHNDNRRRRRGTTSSEVPASFALLRLHWFRGRRSQLETALSVGQWRPRY